ncbi:hypothetical protein HanIR_Chr15g0781971 [Helianthus annuus]|nr:hypothetical protein HanIR_Chr15g0781971 [Helianthus annuus]
MEHITNYTVSLIGNLTSTIRKEPNRSRRRLRWLYDGLCGSEEVLAETMRRWPRNREPSNGGERLLAVRLCGGAVDRMWGYGG